MIISEAAFELILASTLIKRAKNIDHPNWVGSIIKATWPAFLLTLIISGSAGWALTAYCPQATKIAEVVRYCF